MRAPWLFGLVLLLATRAGAQALSGNAEWGYTRASFDNGGLQSENSAFTQAYSLAYRSIVWDPRFLTYTSELSYQTNGLTYGGLSGRARQTGFSLSASMFGARQFPLTVQFVRRVGREAGDYPFGSVLRGSMALPLGTTSALSTSNQDFVVGWLLDLPRLPRVELSYRRSTTDAATESAEGSQLDGALDALVTRRGTRTQHTLRYQRTRFDTLLSRAFAQRRSELGYEFTADVSPRLRAEARAGRRSAYSFITMAPDYADTGHGAYRPPPTGQVQLSYASGSLTHQPKPTFVSDITVSADRERSEVGAASSLLALATSRYQPLTGLSLTARAVIGRRGEQVRSVDMTATTRSVSGGLSYGVPFKLLQVGGSLEAGAGWNQRGAGGAGRTRMWSASVNGSTNALRWVNVGYIFDRGRTEDDLMWLGNEEHSQQRATARTAPMGRLALEATWERSMIERGGPLLFVNQHRSANATAMLGLSARSRIDLQAGQTTNGSSLGVDRTRYYGASIDSTALSSLRLSLTVRRERATSERISLEQTGYYTTGLIEYRVRLFSFGLDYRYSNVGLSVAQMRAPFAFRGNVWMLRVSRKLVFGL